MSQLQGMERRYGKWDQGGEELQYGMKTPKRKSKSRARCHQSLDGKKGRGKDHFYNINFCGKGEGLGEVIITTPMTN